MEETVGVIVGTYGSSEWIDLAQRAVASAELQTPHVLHVHAETLATARNQGAKGIGTDWIIFLDADDRLYPNYIEEMKKTRDQKTTATIIRPSTIGYYEDGSVDDAPALIPDRNIFRTNYIIIGAMHRREDFLAVGGFEEYRALEDWDLWLKLITQRDAKVTDCVNAIYEVNVHPNSRNLNKDQHNRIYKKIINKYHGLDRSYTV